jgi:phytoene dehydrogenase-like protein
VNTDPDVIIIGAGIAGLACAHYLLRAGLRPLLLEASDAPGGRIRTDPAGGFLLDRGFQVLLNAYPECRDLLDYPALQLRPFFPGALIRTGGRFHRVAHPARRPLSALASVRSPLYTFADIPPLARFYASATRGSLDDLWNRPELQSAEHLRAFGLSDRIIDRFFRPFFGGVFFDRDLHTSSRMLEFTFRMFAAGDTVLPARGMGAIPAQLASSLPPGTLLLDTPVKSVHPRHVELAAGRTLTAPAVVVATDGEQAHRLLPSCGQPHWQSTAAVYFAADRAPIAEPILILDGDGVGPVNHLCIPSNIAPAYAPPGKHLISASIIGDPEEDDARLESAVRAQMLDWFGPEAGDWSLLRIVRIRHALPRQFPPALSPPRRPVRAGDNLFICGDHRDNASINGAMASGRRAAAEVIAALAPRGR